MIAGDEVGFDHHSDERWAAKPNLMHDIGQHQRLQVGLFEAVGMRAVDNDVRCEAGFFEDLLGHANTDRVVVRASVATPQDEVTVWVAAGAHDGRAALAVQSKEAVRPRGRKDGVDGNGDLAVGAILETDRRR